MCNARFPLGDEELRSAASCRPGVVACPPRQLSGVQRAETSGRELPMTPDGVGGRRPALAWLSLIIDVPVTMHSWTAVVCRDRMCGSALPKSRQKPSFHCPFTAPSSLANRSRTGRREAQQQLRGPKRLSKA